MAKAKVELKGTQAILARIGLQKGGPAQIYLDNTILAESDPYVPMCESELRGSGIGFTRPGSGKLVYKTPYARRWWYDEKNANFNEAPRRGKKWVLRAWADRRTDIMADLERRIKEQDWSGLMR